MFSMVDQGQQKNIIAHFMKILASLNYEQCTPIALYKNIELFKNLFHLKNSSRKSATSHLELGL